MRFDTCDHLGTQSGTDECFGTHFGICRRLEARFDVFNGSESLFSTCKWF